MKLAELRPRIIRLLEPEETPEVFAARRKLRQSRYAAANREKRNAGDRRRRRERHGPK